MNLDDLPSGLSIVRHDNMFPVFNKRSFALQRQIKENCVQTCLSMLTGIPIDKIEREVNVSEGMYENEIYLACKILGIPIIGQWSNKNLCDKVRSNPYPVTCLMRVNTGSEDSSHMIIRIGNTFYDPWGIKYHNLPRTHKFLGYLEIETESINVDDSPRPNSYRGGTLIISESEKFFGKKSYIVA